MPREIAQRDCPEKLHREEDPLQTQWNALLATALLGTEQRRCTVVSSELEFLSALDSLDHDTDHAEWVLLASAFASTYRRAGLTLPEIQQTQILPAAPAESRKFCSTPVATRLANLLLEVKIMEPFLVESLTLLADKERLVSPVLLPDLLNWARRNKERRALLKSVVGERGHWLVLHNPEWKNVLQVESTEVTSTEVNNQVQVSNEQALLSALNINDNIFSRTFGVLPGHGMRGNGRVIQLVHDKLLEESKPGRTHHSEHSLVKLAAVMPPPILPELTSRIQSALTKGEYTWLPRLADLMEYRHQMLEELARE